MTADRPGINGYQTLERLRAAESTAEIPVVVLSALADDASMWAAWRKGASSYLTKPVDPEALVAEVTRPLIRA